MVSTVDVTRAERGPAWGRPAIVGVVVLIAWACPGAVQGQPVVNGGSHLSECAGLADGTPEPSPGARGLEAAERPPDDQPGLTNGRAPHAVEWTVGVGLARSVELFHSRGGIRYAVQTVAWARDLTDEHGPGAFRGRLAWVVEIMPLLAEGPPMRTWGAGLAPLGFRWTTHGGRRWSAFSEVAGGLLGTSRAMPEGAARVNFTAHWGVGVRMPVVASHAAVIAYRFQHISNGDRLAANPGVNSHLVFVGWSRTDRLAR